MSRLPLNLPLSVSLFSKTVMPLPIARGRQSRQRLGLHDRCADWRDGDCVGIHHFAAVSRDAIARLRSRKKEANRVANLEELLFVNEGSRIRVKPQNSDKILEGTYVILNPRRTFMVGETNAPLRDTGAERIANGESDIAVTTETGVTVMRTSNIAFSGICRSAALGQADDEQGKSFDGEDRKRARRTEHRYRHRRA